MKRQFMVTQAIFNMAEEGEYRRWPSTIAPCNELVCCLNESSSFSRQVRISMVVWIGCFEDVESRECSLAFKQVAELIDVESRSCITF